jgi:allantoinase
MSSIDLIITGGAVVREGSVGQADLAIVDGRIVEIAPSISGSARERIDASGLTIFPGLIDSHVHFNEPGRTEWEGIATGSSALAAGGGTCFFDMPLNSSPPVLDGPAFDAKRRAAEASSVTDFGLWGGLTPVNLDRMEELAARGVVGFKAFLCPSGIDDFPYADHNTLEAGMKIAAALQLPVAVHAEHLEVLEQARAQVKGTSWTDFLRSRPVEAELRAVDFACSVARATGCALHIVHVSHPDVVDLITAHHQQGADVSCETCPHYLLLSDADLQSIGANAKCAPPLRSAGSANRMAIRLHWAFPGIDFVASDHSPAPAAMKAGDAFAAWGGIAGVQSTLAILLNLQNDSTLTRPRIAELTASNVARRYKIPCKGRVDSGHDADLTLVDPDTTYRLTREMLLDRHKLSPYVGRGFRAMVRRTMVRGQTLFLDGKIVSKPIGRFVKPKR